MGGGVGLCGEMKGRAIGSTLDWLNPNTERHRSSPPIPSPSQKKHPRGNEQFPFQWNEAPPPPTNCTVRLQETDAEDSGVTDSQPHILLIETRQGITRFVPVVGFIKQS